jgi:hypothetical protein
VRVLGVRSEAMTEPILTIETDDGEAVQITPAKARALVQDLAGSPDLETQAFRDMLLRWLSGEPL